ncbi:type III-A CRISPR-associated protein Csm2 [Desulfococcaceae bacterium HSG8]|nr:type III-A CRISPR-associated protein Csm2 [Desulfococcaceae bacterium HSG8]
MSEITLWKDRENRKIDPTLFSEKAEKLAITLKEDNDKSKKKNKRTQIRKFYDEVVRLDTAAKTRSAEEWDNILPILNMLIAKAAYAQGRDLVSKNFVKFIRSAIGQISDPKDLSVFANFFEAFMGFYRLHGPAN